MLRAGQFTPHLLEAHLLTPGKAPAWEAPPSPTGARLSPCYTAPEKASLLWKLLDPASLHPASLLLPIQEMVTVTLR